MTVQAGQDGMEDSQEKAHLQLGFQKDSKTFSQLSGGLAAFSEQG